MNEYFIHIDGQPVMVVQEASNGEEEVIVRDLATGLVLYTVDSFDDMRSMVIEYFDGISKTSFNRNGSRLLVALQVATERKNQIAHV